MSMSSSFLLVGNRQLSHGPASKTQNGPSGVGMRDLVTMFVLPTLKA